MQFSVTVSGLCRNLKTAPGADDEGAHEEAERCDLEPKPVSLWSSICADEITEEMMFPFDKGFNTL